MGKAPAKGSKRSSPGRVPVVLMGLGSIGQEIGRAALLSDDLDLIGAVDSNRSLVGRPLSDILQAPTAHGIVENRVEAFASKARGGVLLHATGPRLPLVFEQLKAAVTTGFSVVSTCEELAFPYLKHASLAASLDNAARGKNVSIVGTGVNPGFVLDRLVATVAQVAGRVRKIVATRTVDARSRRVALQRRIGAGLTEDEFLRLVDAEQLGHIGLVESAALAALGAGLDCDDFEEEISPVLATERIEGGAFPVQKGQVAGISQIARGTLEGEEVVRLELVIANGAEETGDRIVIDADVPIDLRIPSGIAGDRATANLVVNAAPRLATAESGLLTVLDLPAGR